jgi:hypothetical protein
MVLFADEWPLRFFTQRNKEVELSPTPFGEQGAAMLKA